MKLLVLALLAATAASSISSGAKADTINVAAVAGSTPTTSVIVTDTLAAGTYSVSSIGIADGGAYDAWTIYAPSPTNGAYTDGWHYSIDGTTYSGFAPGNFNTAAQSLAAAKADGPTTFTLASADTVSFFIEDNAIPYFADDSGGVSLSLSPVAVPEPASFGLLGMGLLGMTFAVRRRRAV